MLLDRTKNLVEYNAHLAETVRAGSGTSAANSGHSSSATRTKDTCDSARSAPVIVTVQ